MDLLLPVHLFVAVLGKKSRTTIPVQELAEVKDAIEQLQLATSDLNTSLIPETTQCGDLAMDSINEFKDYRAHKMLIIRRSIA
eukprot:4917907-Amphidinium_carterae.1